MSVTVKFVDKGYADFIHKLKMENLEVAFGVFENKDVRVPADKGKSESNVEVAMWNEFGTDKAPARPFVRPTMAQNAVKYMRMLGGVYRQYLTGGKGARLDLTAVGREAVKDIKATINSNVPPANAQKTAQRKGHGKTLRDTMQMLNSISFRTRRSK